jgi:prophage regulatory protein
MPVNQLENSQLLRADQVFGRYGFPTCDAMKQAVRRGEFPRPIKIGKRSVAWLVADLDAWVARRVAERDAA